MKTKKITLLMMAIFLVLIASCSSKSKDNLLLGEWKLHSSKDLETNTIEKAQDDEPMYAIINKDAIILTDKKDMARNEEFQWNLKQDSLIVIFEDKDTLSIYLKELNKKRLVVDFNFLKETRLIFERNK